MFTDKDRELFYSHVNNGGVRIGIALNETGDEYEKVIVSLDLADCYSSDIRFQLTADELERLAVIFTRLASIAGKQEEYALPTVIETELEAFCEEFNPWPEQRIH